MRHVLTGLLALALFLPVIPMQASCPMMGGGVCHCHHEGMTHPCCQVVPDIPQPQALMPVTVDLQPTVVADSAVLEQDAVAASPGFHFILHLVVRSHAPPPTISTDRLLL